jgi:fumarate reductase flavoprotein subunit
VRERWASTTVRAFARDIRQSHGTAAAHLVRAYAQAIGPAIDALEQRHGLQFELLEGFLYPGHSALRMHAVPERTGAGLMSRLRRAVDAAGVTVITQALVRELCVAQGQALGCGYLRPDGRIERLRCDAVILACNGFGGNRKLVRELLPEVADAAFVGHAGNDGSAIGWGRALGARLADLGGCQAPWAVPRVLVSWALMMEGTIGSTAKAAISQWTQGYSEAAVQVLAQPGGIAWDVFDDALLAFGRGFPDFREAEAAGAVRSAADVEALAALIGCEAATLRRTLASVREGVVAADGRQFSRRLVPPYHAVKVTGALFHTQGGLDIDAKCRVLRVDGSPWNLLGR